MRASREEPERYLLRFGYGGDGPPPELAISVEGHNEEDFCTMYVLNCTLTRPFEDAVTPISKDAVRRGMVLKRSNTDPNSLTDDEEVSPRKGRNAWICKKRLCDLREDVHDPLKEALGPKYVELFDETPFARHGGVPGTTARLHEWMGTLTACINRGELSAFLLALVLRFLRAPVPKDSDEVLRRVDAAALRARGRCTACTLPVNEPGEETCARCQALRRGAVWAVREKSKCEPEPCGKVEGGTPHLEDPQLVAAWAG